MNATTLDGKVLCGYQGWFNTPCDGTPFGFTHWGQGLEHPERGRFTVDMWPDVSEYVADDLCVVPELKLPDGSPARLYSAYRKGPVLLHTRWMRQYGIDGIFVSRFIGEAASPARSRHVNRVLANLREGCHREGRVWAMMLDLSMGRQWNDEDGDGRLEIPLRSGEGSRGLAVPASSGQAGRPALGTGFQGPSVVARAGRGACRVLQERPEIWGRIPDRRCGPILADPARRVPPGRRLVTGLPLV